MDGLILHRGGREISLGGLRALPTPESLGPRHRPIPHADVVDTLLATLPDFDLMPVRTQLGVSGSGAQLFGVIQFAGQEADSARALGFRSSTDESFAVRGVAGRSVFVCDNLALSGEEFVFSRKHTTFASIITVIRDGISRFLDAAARYEAFQTRMQERGLSDEQAAKIFTDLVLSQTLPDRRVAEAVRNYFAPEPEWTDVAPRTAWGVHNAVTRTLGKVSLGTRMQQSSATTGFLAKRLLAA